MTSKEIIENVLATRGRFSSDDYYERHHITPRCKGGDDVEDNLIDLTAQEHYDVHLALHKENPDDKQLFDAGACIAYFQSVPGREARYVSADEYDYLKRERAKYMSMCKWYTNDIDEVQRLVCPDGGHAGRLKFSDDHCKNISIGKIKQLSNNQNELLRLKEGKAKDNAGRMGYNDGKVNHFVRPEDASPEGNAHRLNCEVFTYSTKGKHKYTNDGVIKKFYFEGEQPDGGVRTTEGH